jgi:membrane protein YqaA with SNARE-associated domain
VTDDAPTAPKPNLVRRIYDWVLSWADTPWAVPALFVLAFVESSFFPIPPDVLLIALALAAPTRGLYFAAVCTAGSVIGGLFGYWIGWAMWTQVEPMLVGRVFRAETFEQVMGIYREHGVAFVFVAAFTPIPYKVFTIAAGVAKLDLVTFTAASLFGRGARFFLVAGIIRLLGQRARDFIDRYFNVLTLVGAGAIVLGFLLLKLL